MLGFLAAVGGEPKFIDECSQNVPGWEAAGTTEDKNDSMNTDLKSQSTIYEKALALIKKAVEMICEFKDDIVKFLTAQKRRYRRLFLAGKTKNTFTWNISGLIGSVTGGISKAATAVKNGVAKVKDAVVDGVKWVGKTVEEITAFIKKQLEEWFKPVFDLIDAMKDRVVKFLKEHPFLMNLLLFIQCFLKNKGVENIKSMFNAIKAFATLIPQLATIAGWVQLVANLICGWESIKEAVETLKKALAEVNKPVRYNLFGKFTGLFVKVVGGS
jgi:hypothetical protein